MLGLIATAITGAVKLGSLIKKATTAAKPVIKLASTATTVAAGAQLGSSAVQRFIGGSTLPALPPLPGLPAQSYPVATGFQTMPTARSPIVPAAQLRQFAIPAEYCRQYIRGPRGTVIVRDQQGPFCLPKAVAKQYGYWHPARKPPISAGDWHKYQTAKSVEKKLVKLARGAMRKHGRAPVKGGSKRK